ncbi:hypothetical protein B2J88_33930 [Rhodococcus sp. SRB_17]|nr:hypothetical protein [Acidovorax sp. SRB_24]NMM78485.1 hypothetical protein [Acidovorax sp. SRB_24]NMM89285.1 hypothetical protein [Rhodococcus sp. SRB_17]
MCAARARRQPACGRRFGADQGLGGHHVGSMRKSRSISPNTQDSTMDAEHINQIGNTLIDLSERTQELRGYL